MALLHWIEDWTIINELLVVWLVVLQPSLAVLLAVTRAEARPAGRRRGGLARDRRARGGRAARDISRCASRYRISAAPAARLSKGQNGGLIALDPSG
jgi:hypothetical protein